MIWSGKYSRWTYCPCCLANKFYFLAATTRRAATARSFVGRPSGLHRAPATNAVSNYQVRPWPSVMQRSCASAFPTITFEEALRREMEYRKRLEMTHPHLLTALNGAPEQQKEVGTDSVTDSFKRKLAPESSVPQQQSSCSAVQRQPANWYPLKKKVKVPHPPSHLLQCPRPNVVPSFWCKICKVDCVTEFNFGAHIGGKKHKAKKLEILGNRNAGRPGSECSGNRNPVQSSHAVSGRRNTETNVSSCTVSADLSA